MPGSLLPDLLTGILLPGKKLKLVYSREAASDVQVEMVQASVGGDTCLRMG